MSTTVDSSFLRRAVEASDLAALRAALLQSSNDEELAKLGPVAELDDDARGRLMDRAVHLLATELPTYERRVPSDDELRRLMDLVLGVPTRDEHFEVRKRMLALEPFSFLLPRDTETPRPPEGFHVAVIGAGLAGIAMAVQLERLGIPYTVFERRHEVGGTWSINRYPDIRVDTASITYEYSFDDQHPWTEYFARGPEVRAYIESMAKKYGVFEHIRFEYDLEDATFDEKRSVWQLRFRSGDREVRSEANAVVSASGLFSNPKLPDLPGLDEFEGAVVHPTRWPDDLDLEGKRVAVVGNGSTGVQLLAPIAEEAAQVHVFQRTPQWISPRLNYGRKVEPEVRWLLENVPGYWNWCRYTSLIALFTWHEDFYIPDPDWERQGGHITKKSEDLRDFLIQYIREQVDDRADLVEKLIPNYAPMVRRPVVDNRWYRSLTRDNVELVTSGIARLTPSGLVTEDGRRRDVDAIVFATGYDVLKYVWPAEYHGLGGANLHELWAEESPRAYQGMMVPGFPNFFMLYGPNSQPISGGISLPSWFQIWSGYIAQCLLALFAGGHGQVAVTREAYETFNQRLDAEAKGLAFAKDANSIDRNYYVDAEGVLKVNTPFETAELYAMQKAPNFDDLTLV